MGELGGLFGYVIIFFFALTVLNYCVKLFNRKCKNFLTQHEKFHNVFKVIMKFLVKNHKLFGLLTIVFILLHFVIQFTQIGLSITGLVAALIMLLQVALGIYGFKAKKKNRSWLVIHRLIAAALVVVIFVHIL